MIARASILAAVLLGGCAQLLGVDEFTTGGGDDTAPDAEVAPDADPAQSASIGATWAIVDAYTADADNAGTCPPMADNAVLVVDGTRHPFPCADGAGTAAGIGLGSRDVWIELTDAADTMVIAESVHANVVLTVAGATEPAAFDVDGYNGFLRLSWEVVTTGCNATEVVSALTTIGGTAMALEDIALCTSGEAPAAIITSALPVGDVVVSTSLLDANSASIGSAPPASATIPHAGAVVDLGPVQITRD